MNPKTDSKQAARTASTLPVISGLRLTKQRQEVYQVLLEHALAGFADQMALPL